MKLTSYIVTFLGTASLLYGIWNMPLWLLKTIAGILGFVISIFVYISIEEKNEKKNEKQRINDW